MRWSNATNFAGYIPVSKELMIDALPFRSMFWPVEDRIVEYLKYGQCISIGTHPFNPVDVAESGESVRWDDGDWLPYLDWPEEPDE